MFYISRVQTTADSVLTGKWIRCRRWVATIGVDAVRPDRTCPVVRKSVCTATQCTAAWRSRVESFRDEWSRTGTCGGAVQSNPGGYVALNRPGKRVGTWNWVSPRFIIALRGTRRAFRREWALCFTRHPSDWSCTEIHPRECEVPFCVTVPKPL